MKYLFQCNIEFVSVLDDDTEVKDVQVQISSRFITRSIRKQEYYIAINTGTNRNNIR